jgi:glutathione-regulated potassium-efflux system ancillary protein KefC
MALSKAPVRHRRAATAGLQFALLLSQGGEFAFVVFGAAETAQVFTPRHVASMLVVVVALSMVATPLLLLAARPRHGAALARRAKKRKPDGRCIEPNEDHVIIAGFGRFGQIVGRC